METPKQEEKTRQQRLPANLPAIRRIALFWWNFFVVLDCVSPAAARSATGGRRLSFLLGSQGLSNVLVAQLPVKDVAGCWNIALSARSLRIQGPFA